MATDTIPETVLTADQGMLRLIEGNRRFMEGRARFPQSAKKRWLNWREANSRMPLFWVAAIRAFHLN
jgi:hypothetical protein